MRLNRNYLERLSQIEIPVGLDFFSDSGSKTYFKHCKLKNIVRYLLHNPNPHPKDKIVKERVSILVKN